MLSFCSSLQPMSVITASEDDASPIIMVWDLRNSLAPERVSSLPLLSFPPRRARADDLLLDFPQILSGHDKGVLSVSWCKQDPDLLLSCGKDNRTILWNPQSSEILGEVSFFLPFSSPSPRRNSAHLRFLLLFR